MCRRDRHPMFATVRRSSRSTCTCFKAYPTEPLSLGGQRSVADR
jgi:hypothetical protein